MRRKLRGGLLVLTATLIVWAAVGVGIARADVILDADLEPHGHPAAASIEQVSDATGQWLRDTLHAEVVQRPFLVTAKLASPNNVAEFWTPSGVVYLLPRVSNALTAPRTQFPEVRGWAAEILVHEWLHRAATRPCWIGADGFRWEEGIVEALTADLLPAWGQRFWRTPYLRASRMYRAEVAAVRAASAKATGSRTWRTPAARAYRRALWAGSCEQRSALLALAA